MLVQSFLVKGAAVSAVANRFGSLHPASLDALVLMSLGMDHMGLVDIVQKNKEINCPVFLTETYGILGYDEEQARNIELMEKGRGSEYGFAGGSGGEGCLAIGYSGDGVVAGCDANFPAEASSMMVIADQSGSWAKVRDQAPVHYGGITKMTWKLTPEGDLEEVPYFWIAETSNDPVGVSAFKEDPGGATRSLLSKVPTGSKTTGAVGLFPCFTRGVNLYGKEDVEPIAVASAFNEDARVYGMFAHGELGPTSFADYVDSPNKTPCTQHSMTSILSIHTEAK